MSLASPSDFDVGKDNNVEPINQTYNTATLVDKDTNINEILPYISGYDWKVTYINQIKAEDDLLSNLDTTAPASIQQYARITGMVLKVQTPIDVTNISDITGEAIVTGNIVPQREDFIVATLAGNRPALLRVTSVTRKHYSLTPVFDISYVLDGFVDTNPDRYDNLLTKIVKELYYDENYIETNSSPILLNDTYNLKKEIEQTLATISEYYISELLDSETRLMCIPGTKYIDLGVQEFFMSMSTVKNSPGINLVNIIKRNELIDPDDIFKLLLHKSRTFFSLASNLGGVMLFGKQHFSLSRGLDDNQQLLQMKYMGIDGVYGEVNEASLTPLPWTESTNASKYTGLLPSVTTLNGIYLFTSNFYKLSTDDTSSIEKMLIKYMNNQSLTKEEITLLLSTYRYWSKTEKYFYIPFMILLLKDNVMNVNDIIY